jgi:hypothetical protein
MADAKPPIINVHTHIFTGDHVPPWLAKKFIWWPFYYLFPLSGIVRLLRWWYNGPNTLFYKPAYANLVRLVYWIRMALERYIILSVIRFVAGVYLTVHVFFLCFGVLNRIWPISPHSGFGNSIKSFGTWLTERGWLLNLHWTLDVLAAIFLLLFFKPGRNLIVLVLSVLWKAVKTVLGKQSWELINRYVLIGRYARYKSQGGIFSKLSSQYPDKTGFVVLPMDMEFMRAGKLRKNHRLDSQMAGLVKLKKNNEDTIFPFVFADPRRIAIDPGYFNCHVADDGTVTLEKGSAMHGWFHENDFSGIKIYPALGYFPFDVHLLLLWKYACDNNIPIITHCIRGTIFYRGSKKKEWDSHPIFCEFAKKKGNDSRKEDDADDEDDYVELGPMLLPQDEPVDFSTNFTHPLNYLCLLDEELLQRWLQTEIRRLRKTTDGPLKAANNALADKLIKAFGNPESELKRNLSKLKLCFGHFGGDDEWRKFYESDRDNYSSQVFRNPDRGVEFLYNSSDPVRRQRRRGKISYIWKEVDWYTIIRSLMLQYPNVYADVSYILHDRDTLPLLKDTIDHHILKQRVLYGSDFYVVRNHVSDKEMASNTRAGLTEDEFDQIARFNPADFLKNSIKK